jgi:hypothetical protein
MKTPDEMKDVMLAGESRNATNRRSHHGITDEMLPDFARLGERRSGNSNMNRQTGNRGPHTAGRY